MKNHMRRAAAVGAGLALALTSVATTASASGGGDWQDDNDWGWQDENDWKGWQDARDWKGWQDDYPQRALASGLAGPLLGLAVDRKGNAYASNLFGGGLTAVDRSGATSVVVAPGTAVSGVAAGRNGSVAWIEQSEDANKNPVGSLKLRAKDGTVTTVTDQLAAYELNNNPDGDVMYGFTDLSPVCKADPGWPKPPAPDPNAPPAPPPPSPNPVPGDVNPNPYALDFGRNGSFFVADAGGNYILRVSASGDISLVALLPPREEIVTAEAIAATGLPACTLGTTYRFHPVPTDVEVGDDGRLYVSSLPGGPEDDSLGRRGGVFRVNPWSGRSKLIATGFLGAVDLAVDDDGRIYVAELFGNSISRVTRNGEARKVLDIPTPGAIEYFKGRLYVTSDNFGPGGAPGAASVVRIKL